MWQPWLRVTLLSLLALMPSMLSVVLLWYFEVLNRGGPLIIVLLVPALGWYVTQLIKISHNRRETGQVGTSSDPPPRYEKVMADPPPYDALYSEKPPAKASSIASTKPSRISDKLRPTSRFCDAVVTISLANTHFFPPEPSDRGGVSTSGSVEVENEPLIVNTILESGGLAISVVDERHDPDLPSYQDAVRTAAAALP